MFASISSFFQVFFTKKQVIIFIGKNGIKFATVRNNIVIETIYTDYKENNFIKKQINLLDSYRGLDIVFLLDNKEVTLTHEMISILSSVLKANPIEHFIKKNFNADDIIAHNVYELNNNNGEVWSVCIAYSHFVNHVKTLIEHVMSKKFRYTGTYFLSLEFEQIIKSLLIKTYNAKYNNYFQVCIIISQISSIRLITKYKNNILNEKTIKFPFDKSDQYIQGFIKQQVEDQLLYYKPFIDKLKLPTCTITLSSDNLKETLSKMNIDNCDIVSISSNNLLKTKLENEIATEDNLLIELFSKKKLYKASNYYLKSIANLTILNRWLFNIMIIFAIIIGAFITATKYQSIILNRKTTEYNNKYYLLLKEYNAIKKHNPRLQDATDLVELYNLKNLIKKSSVIPTEYIKNIFLILEQYKLDFDNLSLHIINPDTINLLNNTLKITINYHYDGNKDSAFQGNDIIDKSYKKLKSALGGEKIHSQKNIGEQLERGNNIVIPVNLIFNTLVRTKKNAK